MAVQEQDTSPTMKEKLLIDKLASIEKELKKVTEEADKHEKLVMILKDRVECPVCLDIPTIGPIYSCPNGHCICYVCYQGQASNCPVCRTRVAKTCWLKI